MELIKGVISIKKIRLHKEENLFTIAEGEFLTYEGNYSESKKPVFIGYFPVVFVGDVFEVKGYWRRHHIYGYSFVLTEHKRVLPRTKRAIIDFFVNNVEGVGVKTATEIVKTLGLEAISKIQKNPSQLLRIKGIGKAKATEIHDVLKEHLNYEEIATFLLSHGGSYDMVHWVYQQFRDNAVIELKNNPYVLIERNTDENLSPIELFEGAEKVANNLNFSPLSHERMEAVLLTVFEMIMKNNGDVFIKQADLKESIVPFLEKNSEVFMTHQTVMEFMNSFEMILDTLLVKEKLIRQEEDLLYLNRYLFYENEIVKRVNEIEISERKPFVEESDVLLWLEEKEYEMGFSFDVLQKKAVIQALEGGISILTGGPGTGKTQTLSLALECLKSYCEDDVEVLLLAPTGRASKRMNQLTGLPAQTIHKAIGMGVPEKRRITAKFVVVDEMSMADIYIMYNLLKALPDDVTLLLVGDVNQLPSIGAGLILRDFIDSGRFRTTQLTKIFRQSDSSHISINAHALNNGGKLVQDIPITNQNTDFYWIEREYDEQIEELIIRTMKRFIELGYPLEDIKVLTPMNFGTLGTWRLNNVLQSVFNPLTPENRDQFELEDTQKIRVKDLVLQTENDNDLKIMNGDIGVVRSIFDDMDRGVLVEIDFDGHTELYDEEQMKKITLAYATTIHKSQGSEYPVVIMPYSQNLMYNRNLIYTGWTRATDVLINIGSIEVANEGIDTLHQMSRNSRIKEKIAL